MSLWQLSQMLTAHLRMPMTGVEPARLMTLDPKSRASTYSATSANESLTMSSISYDSEAISSSHVCLNRYHELYLVLTLTTTRFL